VVGVLVARRAGRGAGSSLTTVAEDRTVSLTAQGAGTVVDDRTVAVDSAGSWSAIALDGVATGAAVQGPAVTVKTVDVSVGSAVSSGQRLATVQTATGSTTDIDAPAAGTVRSVGAVDGEHTGGTLFTVGEGPTRVTVPVSEYDVPALRDGQSASLSFAGVTSTGSGSVESIGATPATDSSGSGAGGGGTGSGAQQTSSVTSYPVVLSLGDVPSGVRTGMDVQVTITVQSIPHVLAIPVQALHGTSGDISQVTVLQGKRQVSRTVHLGLVGDDYAQVTSGLSSGEAVVTGSTATGSTSTGGGHGGLLSGLR
jgi:biotin carboxyl carrier protein